MKIEEVYELMREIYHLDMNNDAGSPPSPKMVDIENLLTQQGVMDGDGRYTEYGKSLVEFAFQ